MTTGRENCCQYENKGKFLIRTRILTLDIGWENSPNFMKFG